MKKKGITKFFIPDTRIYLIIIGVLVVLISMHEPVIGMFGIVLIAYLIWYNRRTSNIKREEWTKYIEELSSEIDSATKQAILNMPIPLTIIEFDGMITWYNQQFIEMAGKNDLLEKDIQDVIPNFNLKDMLQNKNDKIDEIKIRDGYFKPVYNIIKITEVQKTKYIIMLYWLDRTSYRDISKKYLEEKMIIALIQVDNYDEVMQNTEEADKPLLIAEIEHKISLWVSGIEGIMRKYTKDKFIVIFVNKHMKKLEEKRFDILDEIREIYAGNKIPVTLSIGIGMAGENPMELGICAKASKDLALGRGGDQTVVKRKEKTNFYGGKMKAVEKSTKVKSRVISHALKQLMEQADNVLIMGHKHSDLDALGSALGIYRAAKNLKKEAYIVLNSSNPSIEILYNRIMKIDEYRNNIISSEKAKLVLKSKTLLVVVDTHRPSFTECPELLKHAKDIVLIDHHRKGTEFIENTVLGYHETYVSSTSELVTEILYYMYDKMNIKQIEAEALLSGIALDTKNFTFKTGVRTFEAAALLRRAGADTVLVKQLFQNDFDMIMARGKIVKGAEIYREIIAIASCEGEKNIQLIAAQAANELLNIKGVAASFVLGRKDEGTIFISGRSMGSINVQVILEQLGGGGHLTVAGAQIERSSMNEAKKEIKEIIDNYLEEGDSSESNFN
ncbi:MAG: DHH family phosphoesterase [Clostridiales bacterium]|nr:DHH family phosphoesterase [Clostridiales bacterium]